MSTGCDNCDNWYHGDCINVTEKEAKHIKHYYCQKCREENPDLRTIFRIVPVQEPQSESKPKDTSTSERNEPSVKEEKPKKIKKVKPPKEKSKKGKDL
uniref:PHD-type domain-containing protein n=1 Tax=Megaselia scalaris TaxID=36166 RepID=T1GH53_MEGSC